VRSAVVVWHALKGVPKPLLIAAIAGWMLLAQQHTAFPAHAFCLSGATITDAISAGAELALALSSPGALLVSWAGMILAMMTPLLALPLLHVWYRSLHRRRLRAVALFVFGYAGLWIAAGALLFVSSLGIAAISAPVGLPPVLIAALSAALWQATPLKQISLNRSHNLPPLAAFGLPAELDVLQYGIRHAISCIGSCWGFMLLALSASGLLHWIMMASAMLLSLIESVRPPMVARWGAALPDFPRPLPSRPMRMGALR
jgi:predicted metal-binding membrane protein